MRALPLRCTLLIGALAAVACGGGDRASRLNVRPPAAGTPRQSSEVTGIYRTARQATLQLRGDGSMSLIVPVVGVGPSAGSYRLADGRFEVRTDQCGSDVGRYTLEVGGPQVAGEAFLSFTAVSDPCRNRSRYLTMDPWIYSDS